MLLENPSRFFQNWFFFFFKILDWKITKSFFIKLSSSTEKEELFLFEIRSLKVFKVINYNISFFYSMVPEKRKCSLCIGRSFNARTVIWTSTCPPGMTQLTNGVLSACQKNILGAFFFNSWNMQFKEAVKQCHLLGIVINAINMNKHYYKIILCLLLVSCNFLCIYTRAISKTGRQVLDELLSIAEPVCTSGTF